MLLTCSEYMGKDQLKTGLLRESSMHFWKVFLLDYGFINLLMMHYKSVFPNN